MIKTIITALAAGFFAGMPPGPVLVLILQKSLGGDRRGAIQCGAGSAIVDTSYVIAGFYALSLVEHFIELYQNIVMICGGLVVAIVGGFLVYKYRPLPASGDVCLTACEDACSPTLDYGGCRAASVSASGPVGTASTGPTGTASAKSALGNVVTTALCAFSNPGAFLLVMGLVAILGLSPESCKIPAPVAFAIVYAGEILWWTVLSGIASRFSGFKPETFHKISRLSGLVVIAFGLYLIGRGIIISL